MGRSSVVKVSLLAVLLIWAPRKSVATSHIVGDSQGWGLGPSYESWANGTSFAAGDTLVFNYQPGMHSVARVNAAGYKNCKAPNDPSKLASTGNDKFALKKGPNYFICGMPGHCSAGMRVRVNAR